MNPVALSESLLVEFVSGNVHPYEFERKFHLPDSSLLDYTDCIINVVMRVLNV